MYEVVLYPEAKAAYARADRAFAKKIAKSLVQLEQNPRKHPNIKALKGNLAGLYRYRVGDYRMTYQIDDETMQVLVVTIKHRSEAYE